ncbi:MAG: hypothetical protein K2H14_04650 [Muribaculaceae bacterium]|nr:hypothetical protein [Muribaculaceae bacterium]
MKFISLAITMLATAAVSAQTVADPGLAATFENWADRADASYITAMMSQGSYDLLKAKGNATINVTSGYPDTWGDVSRYSHHGGSVAEWLNTKRIDSDQTVSEWPNALFCGYTWWNWGSSIWQRQSDYSLDLTGLTPETRVHFSIKVLSEKAPQVLNIGFFTDNDGTDATKKVSPRFSLMAENVNWWYESQAKYPVVGRLSQGDWLTVDISFAELDALNTAAGGDPIDYGMFTSDWKGNVYHIEMPYNDNIPENDGAVFALDGIYLYTPGSVLSSPVYAGELKEDVSIDATFSAWENKKAVYDVIQLGDIAVGKLDADENVTKNVWQCYASAWGNLWRITEAEGEDQTRPECSDDFENRLLGNWPNHLFEINEWADWGDGNIELLQGEGLNADNGYGVNLSHFTPDTRFHMSLKLFRNDQEVPQPINVYLFRQDENDLNCPRFSIMEAAVGRTSQNHADAPNPVVTGLRNGQWLSVDMSLGELDAAMQQMSDGENSVDYARFNNDSYTGNVYNVHIPLDKNNARVNNHLALDGIYFYTPQKESADIEDVAAADVSVSVEGRIVTVTGGEGIAVYNPAGIQVAHAAGNMADLSGIAAGVYVVKAAGAVVKVIVN